MIVKELKITYMRAIENTAEFHFKQGFNLIVGVNGVGKTTVLDALRICLSRIFPLISQSKVKTMSFSKGDIRNGFPLLDVSMLLDVNGREFGYTRREWREKVAKDNIKNVDQLRRAILDSVRLRDSPINLLRELDTAQPLKDTDSFAPEISALKSAGKKLERPPLCVFYSVNRSVISVSGGIKGPSAGGVAAAYANALVPRSWNIRELSDWMRSQNALKTELPIASQHLDVLQSIVPKFIQECDDLLSGSTDTETLTVTKKGKVLDVRQLSDGEKGILSMVLDLAKRLSQANPNSENPLKTGEAIVLIDEIDLHLHPKWQHEIVQKLCEIFPNCQFIATTHSPQVIGEVEHERIQIIKDGNVCPSPPSYGLDSSRVLEGIMEADSRTREVQRIITQISDSIGREDFENSRELLTDLKKKLRRDDDPEVTRLQTLLDFLEGKD
jgi:ABC-type multidrug transport system ATPase subunit